MRWSILMIYCTHLPGFLGPASYQGQIRSFIHSCHLEGCKGVTICAINEEKFTLQSASHPHTSLNRAVHCLDMCRVCMGLWKYVENG